MCPRFGFENLAAAVLRRGRRLLISNYGLCATAVFQTGDVGGISIVSAGTRVFTDTCGQLRPLKFNVTFCVY